jgi:hypothetical protein
MTVATCSRLGQINRCQKIAVETVGDFESSCNGAEDCTKSVCMRPKDSGVHAGSSLCVTASESSQKQWLFKMATEEHCFPEDGSSGTKICLKL